MIDVGQIVVYADGMDHPEGVTTGPDGAIWAGGEAGQVYRIDPASGEPREIGSSGGFTLGLVVDAGGCVYTCDPVRRGIVVFAPDGRSRVYSDGSPAGEVHGANHLAFDAAGNIYFSDSGHWKEDDGRIFRVRPGGEAEIWCEDLRTVPNGVCLGPGGTHLYVAMSIRPGRISRVEIRDDGSAGAVEDVAIMDGTVPDGLAFDANGNLYVVTYRPDSVFVIPAGSDTAEPYAADPEGTVLASPTNLAFGEVDGEPRLFAANIGRWHVASMPVPTGGLPLNFPDAPGLGY